MTVIDFKRADLSAQVVAAHGRRVFPIPNYDATICGLVGYGAVDGLAHFLRWVAWPWRVRRHARRSDSRRRRSPHNPAMGFDMEVEFSRTGSLG